MKYLLTFLLCLFLSSPAHAWTLIQRQKVTSTPPLDPTPTAYFKLDVAGGTGSAQLYDEVSGTWVGGGADTVTFVTGADGNALFSDSTTSRAWIPGTLIDTSVDPVITIRLQVKSAAQAYQTESLYMVASGNTFRLVSPYGRVWIRSAWGTDGIFYTWAAPSVDTWHEYYVILDTTAGNITIYQDDIKVVDETDADAVDAFSDTANLYLGYVTAASNSITIDEIRIYDEKVTP